MFRRAPRTLRAASTAGERSEAEGAREAALRLIERTRRTRADLRRRLGDRGYAPGVVEDVLERLTAVGLVNDVEYARAFLAGRWGRKMAGWRQLELELRRRGLSAADVQQARVEVEREVGPVNEVEAARRVVVQAARRVAAESDPRARRRKLYSLLVRRGFDGDTIEQALREEEERVPKEDS